MRHLRFVVSLGCILLVGCLGVILKTHIKNKTSKENFVELNDRTRKHIRNNKGMEKCDALFVETPDMPKDDYLTMTHFVNGLRLRKWKPNKDDDFYPQMKEDKEYCYMYNDELNDTQDTVFKTDQSGFDPCTKDNPMFNTPLVTNVFNSDFRDRAHNIPIRKCVFELDKDLLKDEKLVTEFWNKWNRQDCLSLERGLRQRLSDSTEKKNALIRTQKLNQDEFIVKSNDLGIVRHDLFNCRLKKKEIELELKKTEASLEEYKALYKKEAESLANIKVKIQELEEKIQELGKKEEELKSRYESLKADYELCHNNELPECQRSREAIKRENAFIQEQLDELRAEVDRLKQELTVRLDLLRRKKEELRVCETEFAYLTNKYNELKPEYERIKAELDACEKEKEQLKKDYENYKETYETFSNVYYECENEREILNERIGLCQNKVEKCVNDVHNMVQNIGFDFEPIAVNGVEQISGENPLSASYFSVNWAETEPFFNNFGQTVDLLKRQTTENSGKLDICKIDNKSILEDIAELRKRGTDLRQRIEKLEAEKREDLGRSYSGITQDQTEANKELRASLMHLNENNIRDKIDRGCKTDKKDLETELVAVTQEQEQLESRLKQVTEAQDRSCATSCDISVEQCLIHKGHAEICGEINIEIPEPDEEEPVSATFDIYDQTNQKIQTIHFTAPGQNESVSITGASEIKFVEFTNNNPKSGAEFAISGVTGRNANNLCPSENVTQTPYIMLNIEKSTTFRKVHMYRGITCVHMYSSHQRNFGRSRG